VKGDETALSRADGGKGTGLGLAIAKGILEAHGGSIKAESPVANGRGARFVMIFPREEPPA
jgi:two-component system sensor histidine kinase KdpD